MRVKEKQKEVILGQDSDFFFFFFSLWAKTPDYCMPTLIQVAIWPICTLASNHTHAQFHESKILTLNTPESPMRAYLCTKSLQSCPTLCDPMDCSPPGSSVHKFLKLCMTKPQPLERLPELILGWGPGHMD